MDALAVIEPVLVAKDIGFYERRVHIPLCLAAGLWTALLLLALSQMIFPESGDQRLAETELVDVDEHIGPRVLVGHLDGSCMCDQ